MIQIIDENPDFVVINKPEGIAVQREQGQPGVLQLTASQLGLKQLLPVHRLDKVTSGLLLMAKHPAANRQLAEQFAERSVTKYYLAVSDQKPKKKQGLIRGDMDRSRRGTWKLLASTRNPAMTQFFSQALSPGQRAFLLKPLTGKTHQLRVALKSLSAPILGDQLYGGTPADRTYLHAYALSFSCNDKHYSYRCWPQTGAIFRSQEFEALGALWQEPSALDWPTVKR